MALMNSARDMDVYSPAAIGNVVVLYLRILHVALLKNIIANQSSRFTLIGPEAHKFQTVIRCRFPMRALVLNVVPHAE